MPIHAGITGWTGKSGWRADQVAAQAASAESLGFDSYWLPENHFGDARSLPSPLLILAAAAASTTRIRLATTSYLLPIRHPIMAAEEVGALDQLSGGRLLLGVGRGIQNELFDAFGIDRREKRQHFERNLALMLAALRGEPVASTEARSAPLPLQRPHPPIWVAAFGPLALKQAGRLGLPYLASPVESLSVLAANLALYREALEAAGQSSPQAIPVMRTVAVVRSAPAARQIREFLTTTVPAAMADKAGAVDDWAIVGEETEVRERLQQYREELGLTHLIARGRIAGLSAADEQFSQERILDSCASL